MPQFSKVILVDSHDNEIGIKDKLQAHLDGDLHRAFSIFIFNSKNELLLQKRAATKYHSPNLWTNTCCSHPQPGVSMDENLQARLQFEMGINCKLKHWFSFTYQASFENGLVEHEFDHVYKGNFEGTPIINLEEVSEYKYINLQDLKNDIKQNQNAYSAWLVLIIDKIVTLATIV